MWLNRLFKGRKEQPEPVSDKQEASTINQGIYYLYMIIGVQIAVVFGILAVIMFIGKVISTPAWVFLFLFLLFTGSLIYVYRKAKKQFRKIKESLNQAEHSDKNYEISIMGGMLTMRIEQNPNAPRLLAPPSSSASPAEPIIDAEKIEPPPDQKRAHLS
jgi:hypothetical protein